MTDLAALRQQLQTAEAEWHAERLNLEQLLHQCERERDELVQCEAQRHKDLSTSRAELAQSQGDVRRLEQALELAQGAVQRLQAAKDELDADLDAERARSAQLTTRNAAIEAEIDRIRDDCARYSDRQIDLTKQVNETERALSMEKALLKPVQIQLADSEQRRKLVQAQNEALERELESRSEQLLQVQRKHGAQMGQLASTNETLKAQCQDWESKHQAAVDEIVALKGKLTEALHQVEEERNAAVSASCQYQSELDAEKRLSTALKRSLNESKQTAAELVNVVESLRVDYRAATDRVVQLEQRQRETDAALATSNENVDSLSVELDAVRQQYRSHVPVEPQGAMSLVGVTIEDVYGRLAQTSQQLIDERARSRKLQLYLEQIQEEVQEQYPLLQEQRADYQNLVKVNSKLALRVQECNYQRNQLERKLHQALQRAESEYKRRQELIHFVRSQGIEGFDGPVDAQVAVVAQDDDDVRSWRKLVEQLEQELNQRDLQLARLETEIASRNVAPAGNTAPAPSLPMAPGPGSENGDQKLIEELRDQVQMLQGEKIASETQLQSNVDEARRQSHELTMKLATTEGSVALLNQKLDWITSQATRFSTENDKLRAHDAQRDALLIVTQEKLSTATSELADSNQRYTRSCNQLQQVRAQLELTRQTADRLTEQCGDMAVLRQHNEQLLAAMHSVQQKLETGQSSNVEQLISEKERIYKDMLQSQKQAAVERRQLQQNVKVLEEQCRSLQSDLVVANTTSEEANAKLAQLSAAAGAAETAHANLMEELRAVKNERDLLASHGHRDDEAGGRQLMIELAHAQAEAQSLQEKAAALSTEAAEWKALCEQRALLLNELEESLRAQRQRSDSDIDTLRNRVEQMTEQCRNSDQQCEELMAQLEQKNSLSVNQAKELEGRVADAERRAVQAEQQYRIAQDVAESKEQEAADYRRRYETELTGHAQAITALNEVREQLCSVQKQLEQARHTESDAVDALNALQEQSQRDAAHLGDLLKQARDANANLTKQNDLLLAQIETGRSAKTTEAAAAGEGDDADRTRQIVTFLRSEKEVAEAEAESASRHVTRLKTEVEQLRAGLDQARAEIATLQEERQSSMQLVKEATPSEDVAVLLESNQMLRNQKMQLMGQLKQVEDRLAEVQYSSGPMQAQIAELTANVASLDAEKSALEADVVRWKTRNQQLLSRYNQVDPELYRQTKESLSEAKQEIEQFQSRLQYKDNQIIELQDKLTRANQGQANIETIRKSAVFNLQQVNALKRELQARPDPSQFVAQLSEAQKCIKTLRGLCSRSRSVLEKRNETVASLQGQVEMHMSEIATLGQHVTDLQDRLSECETLLHKAEERRASDQSAALHEQGPAVPQEPAEVVPPPVPEPAAPVERIEDVGLHHKRPPSPNLQSVPKKLKTQETEEPGPAVSEPDRQLSRPEETGAVPIRRLRRVRAASAAQEAAVALAPESGGAIPTDEDAGEGDVGVEDDSAAAGGTGGVGPSSEAEDGEIVLDQNPSDRNPDPAPMDI